ncbi:MAG: hypothetical protein EKK29_15300 [Hyphomicrobiales bacterium]|nr:MAG: hypothetical protein EKK29_15300 [Hyphomicrobiales bacterium]
MIGQNIFREKHRERFLTVDKAKFSSRLSAEALGVHDYLLSKSDDWIICEAHIRNRFGWGRKKYQRVMRELRSAGYLQLRPIQSAVGRFVGTKYVLFEKAQQEDVKSKSLCLDSEKWLTPRGHFCRPAAKGAP